MGNAPNGVPTMYQSKPVPSRNRKAMKTSITSQVRRRFDACCSRIFIYFLNERSTVGTSRSAGTVISKSSDGLKPKLDAIRFDGNVCCDVLNFVAMSL